MIDFTVETPIDRPADEVFAYVTDPGKLATWQTNTVSSTPEPPGPSGSGPACARSTRARAARSSRRWSR